MATPSGQLPWKLLQKAWLSTAVWNSEDKPYFSTTGINGAVHLKWNFGVFVFFFFLNANSHQKLHSQTHFMVESRWEALLIFRSCSLSGWTKGVRFAAKCCGAGRRASSAWGWPWPGRHHGGAARSPAAPGPLMWYGQGELAGDKSWGSR